MTKHLNRTYLQKWLWPMITSSINAGLAASGAVAVLTTFTGNDLNLLSLYNIILVFKAWCVVFTFGFVGCMITTLAKSPLDFEQLVIDSDKDVKVDVKVTEIDVPKPPDSPSA